LPDQISGLFSPFLRRRRLAASAAWLGSGPVLDVGCGTGALAHLVHPENYVGIDTDEDSLIEARRSHPEHRFEDAAAFLARPRDRAFDTVIALAVIEHVPEPAAWLGRLAPLLAEDGRVVLTTPHPLFRRVHECGAMLGLFSREAMHEHETLLNFRQLRDTADKAGLEIVHYRRFLCGANQLFILRRRRTGVRAT